MKFQHLLLYILLNSLPLKHILIQLNPVQILYHMFEDTFKYYSLPFTFNSKLVSQCQIFLLECSMRIDFILCILHAFPNSTTIMRSHYNTWRKVKILKLLNMTPSKTFRLYNCYFQFTMLV